MSQLSIEQCDNVTPGFIGACLLLYLGFACQLRNQMVRNPVANLAQDGELRLRWLLFLGFVFHTRALWHGAERKPTIFLRPEVVRLWDGCDPDTGALFDWDPQVGPPSYCQKPGLSYH